MKSNERVDLPQFSDAEMRVMQYACLIPDSGLDEALFSEIASSDERLAIGNLKKRAWLLARGGRISLDPAIRENLKPLSPGICASFLDRLWDAYDPYNMHNKRSLYQQMIPIYLSAFSTFAEEEDAADNAMRAACIMRTCFMRLNEAQALAEYAAETREAHADFAGAAKAYRLSSALLSDLNRPEEATGSALRAYEIDCFRRGAIDPDALAEDGCRLGSARESEDFAVASRAALFTSAVSLYRAIPQLERCLREEDLLDPIYVDPNDDNVVFPLLLDMEQFRDDAEDTELDMKKLLEAMEKSAGIRETFSDRCLDAYLRIMKYLSLHANAQTEASVLKKIDTFLNSLHNSVIWMFDDRLRNWLTDIVEIRRTVFPNDSCVTELVNIAYEWSSFAANHADSEQARREALENCLAAALDALKEAEEKARHEMAYPLAELANVSMDFSALETDPEKAKLRKKEAEQYALRACDACQMLPFEPQCMIRMRQRFREAGIELPAHDAPAEPDPETIRKLFDQNASARAWYLHREQMRKTSLQKKALERYECELSVWNLLSTYSSSVHIPDQAVLSQLSPLIKFADHQWIAEQKARIEAHPGEDILLPYHIENKIGRRIERNIIRCKKCGDVMESVSGPQYAFHKLQTCSCGACGVDGATHVLIRFTRTPSKEDYEELSEWAGDDIDTDMLDSLAELLRQLDEDEIRFEDSASEE